MQLSNLPTHVCGNVTRRQESFKEHLQMIHGMKDLKDLEIKLESCRIGRNYDDRFWCGFCQTIVEITKSGLGARSERFDHIDSHFTGKGNMSQKDISDWKKVDPDQSPKGRDLCAPDSDDSNHSPSPPPNAFNKPNAERSVTTEKKAVQPSKRGRRRRAAESDGRASKRRRWPTDYRFLCVRLPFTKVYRVQPDF